MAVGDVIWTWFKGQWHQGDLPVMNAADHGTWLGSLVFDGARAFEGVVPDIEPHCARVNASAGVMGLKPTLEVAEMVALVHEGLAKFDDGAAVYIRPNVLVHRRRARCCGAGSGVDGILPVSGANPDVRGRCQPDAGPHAICAPDDEYGNGQRQGGLFVSQ